jgi:hypothetical protein
MYHFSHTKNNAESKIPQERRLAVQFAHEPWGADECASACNIKMLHNLLAVVAAGATTSSFGASTRCDGHLQHRHTDGLQYVSGRFWYEGSGTPSFLFLGLAVTHCDVGLTLTQQKYSLELLHREGMLKCKAATTPMSTTDRLTAPAGDLLPCDDATKYCNIVGGLPYFTIALKIFHTLSTGFVCFFMHPEIHIMGEKRSIYLLMVKRSC